MLKKVLLGMAICCFLCKSSLFAQEFWYEDYRKGRNAIREGEWQQAITDLKKAIEKKKKPELSAETFANLPEDYLPYFWLGVAYFNHGELKEALSAFETSLSNGDVSQSALFPAFIRYQTMIHGYLAAQSEIDSLQKALKTKKQFENVAKEKRISMDRALRALRENNFEEASSIISKNYINDPNAPELTLFNALFKKAVSIQSKTDSTRLEAQYNSALAYYLAGNYQAALSAFTGVAKIDKNYRQVESWIRHTVALSNAPGSTIKENVRYITKTDTTSFEPIVIFTGETTTRSDSIAISGVVRDDLGIDFLEITVNGALLSAANGMPLRLRPHAPDSPASFAFSRKVPLQLGENRVVVSAYDLDPQQHSPTFPLTITRKLPIYKTSLFLYSVSAFVILLIGGETVNRLIKRRIAFRNKYNPYIAGAPVMNEKLFFGREQLLKRILNTLHNNSVLLSGVRRIGKTSIQHQLKKRLENTDDADYFFVPVYIDLQGTKEDKFFATMMEDIFEPYKQHCEETAPLRILQKTGSYTARDFNSDLRRILTDLQTLTKKKLKLILQLDEVDALNTYSEKTNQKLRGIFMKTYSENLVAVMSGIAIRKRWESEGSPWYNFFEEIKVEGIDTQSAQRLIRDPVQGIFCYDDEAVARIIALSENVPYRIQKICVHVINKMIAEKRRRATLEDVEAVRMELVANESRVLASAPVE